MKVIASTPAPLSCQLPGTDPRCAYIPADRTDVAETFRRHAPIHVSAIADDYDRTTMDDWLSAPGGFK